MKVTVTTGNIARHGGVKYVAGESFVVSNKEAKELKNKGLVDYQEPVIKKVKEDRNDVSKIHNG